MTLKSVDVGSSSADPNRSLSDSNRSLSDSNRSPSDSNRSIIDPNRSPSVAVTASGISPSLPLDSVTIVNNNNHPVAIGNQVIRTSSKVIMSDDVEMLFTPGSIVTCTTGLGSTIEGEVLAFDYERKLIMLKVPSNQRPGHSDVHLLNLDMVKDVQMVREVRLNENSHSTNPPAAPSISIKKVNEKCVRAVHERKSLASAFASGVTEDGVRLFLNLQKTVGRDPVTWQGKDISVNHILIKPPYSDSCVSGLPKTSEDYVRQLVAKYWDAHPSRSNLDHPLKTSLDNPSLKDSDNPSLKDSDDPSLKDPSPPKTVSPPSPDSPLQSRNDTSTSTGQRRHNANGTGGQGLRSPTPPGGKQSLAGRGGKTGQVLSGKKHAKNGPG